VSEGNVTSIKKALHAADERAQHVVKCGVFQRTVIATFTTIIATSDRDNPTPESQQTVSE